MLSTKETVLCLFGDVKDKNEQVVGYKMLYPFVLALGTANEDGTIPITYSRWCPYTPIQEFKVNGEHIVSVTFPDDGILTNYVAELAQYNITEKDLFFTEEQINGDNSEPAETA
tara:strand:+ start:1293 stop:1634 length:342 start_codon:yes stop_codon:yes gene_type:complete